MPPTYRPTVREPVKYRLQEVTGAHGLFHGNPDHGLDRFGVAVQLMTLKERAAFNAFANLIDPPTPTREWYTNIGSPGHARPTQVPPDWEWLIWLILAGRGYGKTRTGAEWLAQQMLKWPNTFWIIGAPTFSDGRDTCVEGESGLLAVLESTTAGDGPHVAAWNRSEGQVVLKNGSRAKIFSGEEPKRFRGPNARGAWLDELAVWKRLEDAWKMLRFTMRAGGKFARPQTVITTTPKALVLLRSLLKRCAKITDPNPVAGRRLPDLNPKGTLHLTLGSTFENRDNLAQTFLEEMTDDFEGTRLGRQELYAEILEEVEGALWTDEILQRSRVDEIPTRKVLDTATNDYVDVMALTHIVVAVDPAVSTGRHSDWVGIVVVGKGEDGHGYVLEDRSVHSKSPEQWGGEVIQAWIDWQADEIIGEVNNGGDLVIYTIRQALQARGLIAKVSKVNATRGKRLRAEPIVQLYEQQQPLVHHVGYLPRLEEQQTTWIPGESKWSPDRLDAAVWGLSRIMGAGPGKRRRSAYRSTDEEAA